MKKLLGKILLFSTLLAVVLSVVTWFTDWQLLQSKHNTFKVWNELGSRVDADMLIFGNSHAMVQIDPKILSEQLNHTVYNMGIPGYPFDMQLARYEYYRLHNRKPAMILLTVDLNEFILKTICYDKQQFLPYLDHMPIVRALPPYFTAYHYLPFIKYYGEGSLARYAVHRFINKTDEDSALYNNGYHGWDRAWNTKAFQEYLVHPGYAMPDIDREVFERFKTFLQHCRAAGIRVILVATPYYEGFNRTIYYADRYYSFLQNTARSYGADYISFVKTPITLDTNNFYNAYHLNRQAAEKFSYMLSDSLKRMEQ